MPSFAHYASHSASTRLHHALQTKAGLKFERVGAPQPGDMAQVAGERALESVTAVDASVLPFFRAAAQKLLEVRQMGGARLAGLQGAAGHLVLTWRVAAALVRPASPRVAVRAPRQLIRRPPGPHCRRRWAAPKTRWPWRLPS